MASGDSYEMAMLELSKLETYAARLERTSDRPAAADELARILADQAAAN